MKIAFFSDNFYPELSGIADSILTTAEELAKQGHQVRFYVPQYASTDYDASQTPEPFNNPSLSVYRINSFHIKTGTGQGRFCYSFSGALKDIGEFNPDILHTHLPFNTGILALLAQRKFKKPLVGTNHTLVKEFLPHLPLFGDSLKHLGSRYAAWFYNHCQIISTPSSLILEEMRQFGYRKEGLSLSNPISPEVFYALPNKSALKKKHNLPAFTILFVGRLSAEKNPDVILQGFAQVKNQMPDAGIVLVGKGTIEEKLRKMAEDLKISEAVTFFGFVRDKVALNEVYNASDIFAIMSTSETQGMVALQAMMAGTPVVAARSWGLAEYVTEDHGFPIEPGDAKALAAVFLDLYNNQKKMQLVGGKGKAYAEQFTPEAIAKKWIGIYEQTLRGDYNK